MKSTKSLQLLPIQAAHAQFILEHYTNEVNVYMSPPVSTNLSSAQAVVSDAMQKAKTGNDLVFALANKENQELLGLCGWHNLKTNRPHLGIWLKKSVHGEGYGTLAISALLKKAKKLNLKQVYYDADYRNIASNKLAVHFGGKLIASKVKIVTVDHRDLFMNTYLLKVE